MKKILVLFCILNALILSSCWAEKHLHFPDNSSRQQITNSIIYIIHGDGSYLYHDKYGAEMHADEKMVKQARYIAENSPNSEIFIFHIRPGKKFLFLFPMKDRDIYYYKKGKLVKTVSYNTDENDPGFEYESGFYKRFSAASAEAAASVPVRSILLFYGHQIPETGPFSYNASYPGMPFNIDIFAGGLSRFKKYKDYKFDIVVLSSCNNATPGVISKIAPLSKYIVASPGNLHLSHLNSMSLLAADTMKYSENSKIVSYFADRAFDSLKTLTQTEITISIFNSEKIIPFLLENEKAYKTALNSISSEKLPSLQCIDCKASGYMHMAGSDSGVITYYRKSEFGKPVQAQTISGWGCWKPAGN